MADINNYSEQSGRVIGEDGTVYNVVDLLKGDFSGTGRRANIDDYAIKSGRVIGEDGGIYNIVELLQNSGGGGIGEQIQADWSEDNTQSKAYIKNKPTIPTELPAKGGGADTAKKLLTSPTGRPSTADITPDGSGGLIKFLSSGAMTTNKPNGADGHIIHMFWDNDKGYDAQMFMRCNSDAYMMIRGQSGGAWGDWITMISERNFADYQESEISTINNGDGSASLVHLKPLSGDKVNIEYGYIEVDGTGLYTVYFEDGFRSLPSITLSCDNNGSGLSIDEIIYNNDDGCYSSFVIGAGSDQIGKIYWQAMGGARE